MFTSPMALNSAIVLFAVGAVMLRESTMCEVLSVHLFAINNSKILTLSFDAVDNTIFMTIEISSIVM